MYEEWHHLWHSSMRANVSENGNFDPFLSASGSQKDGGSSKQENYFCGTGVVIHASGYECQKVESQRAGDAGGPPPFLSPNDFRPREAREDSPCRHDIHHRGMGESIGMA
ncbi:hypothetical protein CEXT_651341 [Caerostris extrusa]|uniref:Uncharacterized protein n=1 Tax=Caerostris extrusa TaxID=172846 RepID=A0AAV4TDF9_CAEEX|nr:hypothetical protein CEXT_651341 [Caerostris extrusa]